MSTTTNSKQLAQEFSLNSPDNPQNYSGQFGIDDWTTWTKYLRRRRKPAPLWKVAPSGNSHLHPLVWAVTTEEDADSGLQFIKQLDGFLAKTGENSTKLSRLLMTWLDGTDEREPDESFALECLAWAHVLPRLTSILSAAAWLELV